MQLELTEDHKMLQETVRRFVEDEVRPRSAEWDRHERFPAEAVRALGRMGIMGMHVDPEYGGSGLDAISGTIVLEEIGRHDGSLGLTVASHNGLCTGHIRIAGNEEQKRRYLPALAAGEKLGAWGLTEPNSGSDAVAMRTTARQHGDRWILNGSKMFITQGTVGDVFVILAVTSPEKKTHGVTAFIVEKGQKGFSQRSIHGKLGMRASDTAELHLEDVEVPAENVLGGVGLGFIDTLKILDRGRITIAALGVGLLRGCLEESRKYAQDRQQFGRPIAEFQAIQWMLADMAVDCDAARLLTRRAAWLYDQGRSFNQEASMAKLFASEAATRAGMKAIQIHGGYGYTSEFPVERYLRDAKLLEIGEGTSEVQRLVIARRLLGK